MKRPPQPVTVGSVQGLDPLLACWTRGFRGFGDNVLLHWKNVRLAGKPPVKRSGVGRRARAACRCAYCPVQCPRRSTLMMRPVTR